MGEEKKNKIVIGKDEFKLNPTSNIELFDWARNFESNMDAIVNLASFFNEVIEFVNIYKENFKVIEGLLYYISTNISTGVEEKKIKKLLSSLKSILKDSDENILYLNKKNEKSRPSKNQLLLINIWTIYESLTKNLWIFLLNKHPVLFNDNIVEKDKKKNFYNKYFEDSRKNKFMNSKIDLGDLIINTTGLKFSSYKNIQDNYKNLFSKYKLSESNILFQIEKTRHLIVHNLGIIDTDFMENMKRIKINVKVGQELEPIGDGDLLVFLKEVFIEINRLLQFIDNELTRLKETNVIPAKAGIQTGLLKKGYCFKYCII